MAFMGQQATVLCMREASARDRPGVLGRVELTWRLRGNQGDPSVGVGASALSDKCKKRGRGRRLSEVGGTHKSDEVW